VRQRLLSMLETRIPAPLLKVVRETGLTSVQAIETVTVERHATDRLALIGDAGSLYGPFAGSGTLQALGNASSLAARLAEPGTPKDVLTSWGAGQRELDARMTSLAEQNGNALVFDVPDPTSLVGDRARSFLTSVHPGASYRLGSALA